MTKLIFIDEILFDASPKVRAKLNDDVIEDYADRYKAKEKMPPIEVFIDKDKKMLIADGWHRCHAKSMLGVKGIDANIHQGGYKECLEFALTANSHHGLPRSYDDRRTCVKLALVQWPKLSNRELSRICDVSDHLVADLRGELEKSDIIAETPVRVTAKGTEMKSKQLRVLAVAEEPKVDNQPVKTAKVEALVDANGTEIPRSITKYWMRTSEIKELISIVTEAMKQLKEAEDTEDAMYQGINMSATLGDLDNARKSIALAIPYCVCPQCQGHPEIQPKKQCRLCGEKGFISKFIWDRAVPEETKAMITKKKK
jgi:hypothetical protein